MNINVQLSPSSDSGGHAASLKCNPFLHVAASFSKDKKLRAEWAAADLEVKLAATDLSPQQDSNSLGFLGHEKWLGPEDISICMGPMTLDESGCHHFPHCANNIKWSHADNPPLKSYTFSVNTSGATIKPPSIMEHLQAALKQDIQDRVCTYLGHLWYRWLLSTMKPPWKWSQRIWKWRYRYESNTATRLEKKMTNAVKMRSLERIRACFQ